MTANRTEYMRAWRKRNAEKVKADYKAWCAANPERVRLYREEFKSKNPGKARQYERTKYARHKSKMLERARNRYHANIEASRAKARQYSKNWRARNPERRVSVGYMYRYGVPKSRMDELLAEQAGRCAICRDAAKKWHLDHDHDTGEVRGVLCSRCNQGLGFFRDRADYLMAAATYLLTRHARAKVS